MESGGVGFLCALMLTPLWMGFLRARSLGQHIREDGPSTHRHKAGTPTMGGAIIVLAALFGYVMGHVGTSLSFTRAGVLAVSVIVASGLLGFADDYLAIRNARNLGLSTIGKLIGELVIAGVFAVLALTWVHTSTDLSFTRFSLPGLEPHGGGVVLPRGLRHHRHLERGEPHRRARRTGGRLGDVLLRGPRHHRVLAVSSLRHLPPARGARPRTRRGRPRRRRASAFLWWNAPPARIIMGDTGSLAVGTGLGALCLLMNLDLLLVIIGGLFVAETASVILQVLSFRLFGRRIFRIAPFHHHFEMRGWPETTVLIRFWILAGLLAMLGLGIFYGDFLKIAKVV